MVLRGFASAATTSGKGAGSPACRSRMPRSRRVRIARAASAGSSKVARIPGSVRMARLQRRLVRLVGRLLLHLGDGDRGEDLQADEEQHEEPAEGADGDGPLDPGGRVDAPVEG